MRFSILAGVLALLGWAAADTGLNSNLTQIYDYDDAGTGVEMFIYIPQNVKPNAPMIVALHYCTGDAHTFEYYTPYASLADEYGFVVLYPQSPHMPGRCWDVSSYGTLQRNGGGDSNAIKNQVVYATNKFGVNPHRVYVSGVSSGAMMSTVMSIAYPDVFAAGVGYSGVAASCFLSNTNQIAQWNNTCSTGNVIATPEYWKQASAIMSGGYQGRQTRYQFYHGTADTTVWPQNGVEEAKQFTAVNGYQLYSPSATYGNFPQSGYTSYVWGVDQNNPLGRVRAVMANGVGHTVPLNVTQDMIWFGMGPYEGTAASYN